MTVKHYWVTHTTCYIGSDVLLIVLSKDLWCYQDNSPLNRVISAAGLASEAVHITVYSLPATHGSFDSSSMYGFRGGTNKE